MRALKAATIPFERYFEPNSDTFLTFKDGQVSDITAIPLLVNTRLQATRLKTGHSPGLAEHHQGPNVSCPHQETAALAISF